MIKHIVLFLLLTGCSYGTMGVNYGKNTALPFDHSNGEREVGVEASVGKAWDRWRGSVEIDLNQRESATDLTTVNARLVGTYDIFSFDKWQIYTGIGVGLGWSFDSDYDLLIDKTDSEGLVGVLDWRTGIRFDITKDSQLQLQYKVNHISDPLDNDRGSNTDNVSLVWVWYWR